MIQAFPLVLLGHSCRRSYSVTVEAFQTADEAGAPFGPGTPHLLLIHISTGRCSAEIKALQTNPVFIQITEGLLSFPLKQQKNVEMSKHFHFSRLTSQFNSRAPGGDFMNGWVWTAAPDSLKFKHAAEMLKGGCPHMEVGAVPQQVLRALEQSMVTLNSGAPGPVSLYWLLWVLLQVMGPQVLNHSYTWYSPGRV